MTRSDTVERPVSLWLSALAALARGVRLPGGVRLLDWIGRQGRPASIRVRLRPYTLHFDTGDIFQALMALGRYEPETGALLERILRPGDVYIDVGAQLGYTAAQAARLVGSEGRMVLFEPDPRACRRLERHIASGLPGEAPGVVIRQMACSDRAGTQLLNLMGLIGNSSLEVIASGAPSAGFEQVALDRLDSQLDSLGIGAVRLIKMDIEGHELWALRGASGILGAGRADYLLIEKNLGNLWSAALEPIHLHAFMTGMGYLGAHEDGRPITKASLAQAEGENLLYARSAELLGAVFPGLDWAAIDQGYRPGELERCFAEVIAPAHPAVTARQIVRLAGSGQVPEAVRQAGALLKAHPELTELRGHYACWIWTQGQITEALEELRRVEAEQPDNAHVRELIGKLSGASPA